jgi:trk system potassium uptake protein TrkA
MAVRKVAVLGLGRFGMRLAVDLVRMGVEVLALDRNRALVEEAAEQGAIGVALDVTDADALAAQDVAGVDVCVVATGERFESTILATFYAGKMGGSGPQKTMRVVARAQTQLQAEILKLVGADFVIQPEGEAAHQLARRLANPRLEDFIELDEDHSIVQLVAPPSFVGRTLGELRLRSKYRVNLVTIKRRVEGSAAGAEPQRRIIGVPSESDRIEAGDILVLVGEHSALAELPQE